MSVRFVNPSIHDTGLCEKNLNFLAHAQAIELEIGSQCGGHGVCGGDRIRFSDKDRHLLSPVTEAETLHFSAAELASGWRLACQCFPEKSGLDLDVRIP